MATSEMSNEELVDSTSAAWNLLAGYARLIAILPLEDWLEAINRAETLAPVIDPTLWIKGNRKMDDVKRMIQAAMPLKRFVLSMQPKQVEAKPDAAK